MLKNYILAYFRNLRKNSSYSFLNILGLAIGIACAGMIFLWIGDEVHFDSDQVNKDRIYLIKMNAQTDNGIFTHSSTPGPLAQALQSTIPGIEATCRLTDEGGKSMFRIGEKSMNASGLFAEPSLFQMFTLPFVQGNPQTAFAQLHSMVITEATAKKFFGEEENVLGRTVRVDNQQDYVITGVIKDMPKNSSLQFEWVAPFQLFETKATPYVQRWYNNMLTTYVELKPGVSGTTLNQQLLDPKYDYTIQKRDTEVSTAHIFLFGMNHWRLYDQFDNGKETGGGRIQYVRLFSVIAWIILFIACINFMNLATARSEQRAREVGVRKVLGAGKGSLIGQFIGEALFMAFLAAISAILLMSFTLGAFNLLVEKHLSLGLNNPLHWAAILLLTLFCGLLAGSYPSFYLSSFNPVFVLKGIKMKDGSAALIRKGLVVSQFAVSIILVIGTIIIYQQIRYVKSRDLGFNRDHLLQLDLQGNMNKNFQAIRQDLINTGAVSNATLADHTTLDAGNNTSGITWAGKNPNSNIIISQRRVSPEFLSTMGMQLKEGRDFQATDQVELGDNHMPKDSSQIFHVLVTASMELQLGKGSAIGKSMVYNSNNGPMQLLVTGVVKDYVYGDMYGSAAAPVVFYCVPQATRLLFVRTSPSVSPEEALTRIEDVLKKDNPGYPFEYTFVDEQFNQKFMSEMLISKLSRVFASLAIFISCLGLFGLAAYTAERRRKEIGIRKVLGASTTGIAHLLSKDFLQLVLIACVIAFPLAFWIMHNWLQAYAYRIDINAWVFVVAGVLAATIALATVSFQAIKAALANPVTSLRSE